MSDVIDLDAFAPESVTVSLNGKEVVIAPPHMIDVLRIGALSNQLKDLDSADLEAMEKGLVALNAAIKKIAPDLDVEALNMVQIFKVVGIITEMATPADVKELAKQGIEVGADGPKAE